MTQAHFYHWGEFVKNFSRKCGKSNESWTA